LKRITAKPVQQQALIFLGLLALWTARTGRTGFQGEESLREFENSTALGANDPSEGDVLHLLHR
jgi:hypothetical protein